MTYLACCHTFRLFSNQTTTIIRNALFAALNIWRDARYFDYQQPKNDSTANKAFLMNAIP